MLDREIKFRAWNKKAGLLEVVSLFPNTQTVDCHFDFDGDGSYREETFKINEKGTLEGGKRTCILMQFTGLLDKNSKEIYEGDIVMYKDTESEYVDVGVGEVKVAEMEANNFIEINFEEGCFGGVSNAKYGETLEHKQWYSIRQLVLEETEWVEVIGNVYDNPELI